MNSILKNEQVVCAAERYHRRRAARQRNIRTIDSGKLLRVDKPRRVERWLRRRGVAPDEARKLIAAKDSDEQRAILGPQRFRILERQIGRNDQMSVAFL